MAKPFEVKSIQGYTTSIISAHPPGPHIMLHIIAWSLTLAPLQVLQNSEIICSS